MKKILVLFVSMIFTLASAQDDDFDYQTVIFDTDKTLFPDMKPLKPGEMEPEQKAMIMSVFINVPYQIIKEEDKSSADAGLIEFKREILKEEDKEILAFSGIYAAKGKRFIVEHLFIAYAGGTIMIRASYPENKKIKYSEATKKAALTARVKQ